MSCDAIELAKMLFDAEIERVEGADRFQGIER